MAKYMKKPLILVLETTGRGGSVALCDGKKILCEKFFSGPMKHGSELFSNISSLLDQKGVCKGQIADIYLSIGPGSFTGIRIAVTVAKMMSLSTGGRLVSARTSEILVENIKLCSEAKNGEIMRAATIIDAKRKQFFVAVFDKRDNVWVKSVDDCLMTSSEFIYRFSGKSQPIWLLGEGLVYYREAFKADGVEFIGRDFWSARASGVFSVGRRLAAADKFERPEQIKPFYLRGPVAMERHVLRKD
jgi:tRNA threonylcarbamoyladenosine biosynthesis protein TsaB